MHGRGVVHRDVKAANILLTRDGHVKLADFGVACSGDQQHNTVIGTPAWTLTLTLALTLTLTVTVTVTVTLTLTLTLTITVTEP